MNISKMVLISIGLAMDALAVSICKGLSMKDISIKNSMKVGIYFGGFQAIMPLIGFWLGDLFDEFLVSIDHWVVFVLLVIIGINMIFETITNNKESSDDRIDFKTMFIPALATSIDALAVGITFAFLKVNLLLAILLIGLITFIFSFMGVRMGNKVGKKFENKAKILGGLILIGLAIKILIEHLG